MRLRVADLETTGLASTARPLEVAFTDVVCRSEIVGVWERDGFQRSFLNPEQKCEIGALATHHIREHNYLKAPSYKNLANFLHHDFGTGKPDAFVFHNAAYDAQFFETDLPILCTLKCARKAWPDCSSKSNQFLRYWLNLELDDELCDPPHRALPDTYVTSGILIELLRTHKYAQLLEWSGSTPKPAYTTMHVGEHKGKELRDVPMQYLRWVVTMSNMAAHVKEACGKEMAVRGVTGVR